MRPISRLAHVFGCPLLAILFAVTACSSPGDQTDKPSDGPGSKTDKPRSPPPVTSDGTQGPGRSSAGPSGSSNGAAAPEAPPPALGVRATIDGEALVFDREARGIRLVPFPRFSVFAKGERGDFAVGF